MRHGSDRHCCCHDRQLTVYLISLLRSTKKVRLTQEKAIEANRTTTIMPPIVPPNDISLAFAHDGDDDDNDDAAFQNDVLELIDPPPYNTVTTVVNPYAKKPPPAASHEDPKPSADRLVVDLSLCFTTTTDGISTRYVENVPQTDLCRIQTKRYLDRAEAVETASW